MFQTVEKIYVGLVDLQFESPVCSRAVLSGMAAVLVALSFSPTLHAQVSHQLESLASSDEVIRRANKLDSRSRVSIVQGRTVDRNWRIELGGNYGPVAVGDSYLRTQNLGLQADVHVTPRFSLGVRYSKAYNQLTSEGRQQFEQARAAKLNGGTDYRIPDIDYPEESVMGLANLYLLYGKINFFDLSVVQFDIYTLAGFGQIQLASGPTSTWTAGGGVGFWLSQHITSRFELRYQSYVDQVYTGPRDLNLIVGSVALGVLL